MRCRRIAWLVLAVGKAQKHQAELPGKGVIDHINRSE
jgi:hypothetical protein